jgi:hypothetical protein
MYDIIPEVPGDELYVGSYSYTNKIKETWVGLGYGKKVKENLGIGFSVFGTFRDQEMLLSKSADIYIPNSDTANLEVISNTFQLDDMIYRNAGLLFIVGATWSYDKFRFGVNLTTPRINIKFLANSYLKRNYYLYNQYSAGNSSPIKASYWENKVKSVFKSPLTLDLGIEYPLDTATLVYGKIYNVDGVTNPLLSVVYSSMVDGLCSVKIAGQTTIDSSGDYRLMIPAGSKYKIWIVSDVNGNGSYDSGEPYIQFPTRFFLQP